MLNYNTQNNFLEQLELYSNFEENQLTIKRILNKFNELTMIQVLNSQGNIIKCLFYDAGNHLSNITIYNPATGKEIKNISYKKNGKTISSIREYDIETGWPLRTVFYKEDGRNTSSIIEYNEYGTETQITLFDEIGNCKTFKV